MHRTEPTSSKNYTAQDIHAKGRHPAPQEKVGDPVELTVLWSLIQDGAQVPSLASEGLSPGLLQKELRKDLTISLGSTSHLIWFCQTGKGGERQGNLRKGGRGGGREEGEWHFYFIFV